MQIDTSTLKKAAMSFRAINHKLRREMLKLLHSNERMAVTAIYVKLKIEQSVASQHLAILRKARLVQTEREGKRIFYTVNYQQLQLLQNAAGQLLAEK